MLGLLSLASAGAKMPQQANRTNKNREALSIFIFHFPSVKGHLSIIKQFCLMR